MKKINLLLVALLGLAAVTAHASTANAEKLIMIYTAQAKNVNADYAGPTVADGKFFFNRKIKLGNGKEMACASCHTANPADSGKNVVTHKSIKPLSPAVNAQRFADFEKVEAKFTEHCIEIIGSDCTAAEKASYITYLLTEKTPTPKK